MVRTGRWKVDDLAYPLTFFPRYLYGHTYVISVDLLAPMLRTARKLPYFPPEDAFVTGVLPLLLGAPRIHSQRFAVTLRRMYTCQMLSERFLSVTPLSEQLHVQIWDAFKAGACDPAELIKNNSFRYSDVL